MDSVPLPSVATMELCFRRMWVRRNERPGARHEAKGYARTLRHLTSRPDKRTADYRFFHGLSAVIMRSTRSEQDS